MSTTSQLTSPRKETSPQGGQWNSKGPSNDPKCLETNPHILEEIEPLETATVVNAKQPRERIVLPRIAASRYEQPSPKPVTQHDLQQLAEQLNDTLQCSLRALVYNLQNGWTTDLIDHVAAFKAQMSVKRRVKSHVVSSFRQHWRESHLPVLPSFLLEVS